MANTYEGIINPPIDELLKRVDSKFGLVIFASKRARQINDYYSDLHDGSLFNNVGPLVDANVEDESLSIALREIAEDKLELTKIDPAEEAAAKQAALDAAAADAVAGEALDSTADSADSAAADTTAN
ncbi:DNA-directed RNA polymerase subunit omega [Pseudoclavibacter sp. CFCC 13796]|nr:DNA-directed RNA polymerase subunit omega [Pseudoclavibacter sp. CFCC 14310]KAB1658242.1 DNA-directed RNA polymerase subunit omega [Pseudoclavibacter sp. CFCC 11306]KAB1661848.1 DNA-directed RNA polymerase subunit omega [Pseudoclavibacter sp. CFCC 13796]KAB1663431.1 DNA-directed RNA polymerase subunit omega [Pseudoclavibacter sp. CFCC 13611]